MRDVRDNIRVVYQQVNTVYQNPAFIPLSRKQLENELTGAKILGIQKGTERGVGDDGVGCQAECYRHVLDGLDVILGQDGDAEAGARRDCAWDGDAADAGGGEGAEEGEGGGEDGLVTHGG